MENTSYTQVYLDSQKALGEINAIISQCLETAGEFFKCEFPTVDADLSLKGCNAGECYGNNPNDFGQYEWILRFNFPIMQLNHDEFLKRTVPHEVAHYVVRILNERGYWPYERRGRKLAAHGRQWSHVMEAVFGIEASRCHSYTMPETTKRKKTFTYHCGCTEYALTSIRHNRIQAGRKYRCNVCGKILEAGPMPAGE